MKTKMKEGRERLGISQKELAEMVGVSRQTIFALEHGKYNPSLGLARKVTKILGYSTIEDLFIFEE